MQAWHHVGCKILLLVSWRCGDASQEQPIEWYKPVLYTAGSRQPVCCVVWCLSLVIQLGIIALQMSVSNNRSNQSSVSSIKCNIKHKYFTSQGKTTNIYTTNKLIFCLACNYCSSPLYIDFILFTFNINWVVTGERNNFTYFSISLLSWYLVDHCVLCPPRQDN